MKHLIYTRFLCIPMGLTEEKLLDKQLIADHIELLKNNFIPTLNNQTSKNFSAVVICHDKHSQETRHLIENLFRKMPGSTLK